MSQEITIYSPPLPPAVQLDLVRLLLDDKRSPQTRRAYAADLRAFFGDPTPAIVDRFLAGSAPQIALDLAQYKSRMRADQLAEATMNRRLASIKSLLKMAHRLGKCCTDGTGLVDGEKVKAYRDTRGVDVKMLKKLLAAPARRYVCTTTNDVNTLSLRAYARMRDEAILTLLIENALRRAELCALDIEDFNVGERSLWISGKGRGSQKERITLSDRCVDAILATLAAWNTQVALAPAPGAESAQAALAPAPGAESAQAATSGGLPAPIFRNIDRRPEYFGRGITTDGLYALVGEYGRLIGLKRLTPHMLRHSSITLLAKATNGNLVKIKNFSRHAKIETVNRYVDNADDLQGEMSNMLSGLLK